MICILTIAVGFIAVHFFKMLRLYLVLMEHRISFGRFILLYLRTTFINLIIPFKLGELYRILKPVSDHAENIRAGTGGTAWTGHCKVLV